MIPLNRSPLVGKEHAYIEQVLHSRHLSGDGHFTRRCHKYLEDTLGVRRALLTTSCTHALEMAALLLDIRPGEEVIVPSFTFVSSVNAFVLRGAKPIFIDIRPDTLNIDEDLLEGLITPRTRAIVIVHYAGISCEMDKIMAVAEKYGLAVVEDNAHGLFGTYKGRALGSIGPLATLSFHETKNFTCGEGGALLINDPAYVQQAEIIREKGTNRSRFLMGEVDKYCWEGLGSSYLPSEILAAFLYAQLEACDLILSRRRHIFQFYQHHLAAWATENGVRLPSVPDYCQPSYHLFYMLLPTPERQQAFMAYMRGNEVHTPFHYLPLHLSRMGRQWGYTDGDYPVTERVSSCLVRLPFYIDLTDEQLTRVVETVQAFQV